MKRILKRLARGFGLEVVRASDLERQQRASLAGSLGVARAAGLAPRTVIDVGAARGVWSLEAAKVFPEAKFVLLDPLEENVEDLERVCCGLTDALYVIAAAGDAAGTVTMNVHADLDGSSLYHEREEGIDGVQRTVREVTLDGLAVEKCLEGPFLLKADVQGAEILVLDGAKAVLSACEMVILEVLLFDVFQGSGPQLADVVDYMLGRGFVAWDIYGPGYRPLDGALSQVDMAFVRRDGLLRTRHEYATAQQRGEQLAAIAAAESSRLRGGP